MAKKLEITVDQFYKHYTRKIGVRWSLTENVIDGKYDCVFLDRTTQKPGCKLYETRPLQCRTWPFWPENIKSKSAWERTKKETPCPGINTGKFISSSEIQITAQRKNS